MKKMLFIINPKAGKTAIKNDLFEIIQMFSDAGYEVIVYPTKSANDAERKMIEEAGEYDLVVCAGGDGTLENVICGYMKMEKKVPLGYIPVGTTNDYARTIKMSRKPLVAARQILDGNLQKFDVGHFGDKNFIYIAAFGIFTDISYTTNQSLKKVMGHSAYLVEGVKNLTNYKGFKLEARFDDSYVTGEYIFGMITNSSSVAGFKIRGSKHVILDDGKFDCLLIKKPQTVTELQQVLGAMLMNNMEGNEMFFQCKASKVHIEGAEEISWTLDGEYGGTYKSIDIVNEEKAVGLFVDSAGVEDSDEYEDEYDEIEESDELIDM